MNERKDKKKQVRRTAIMQKAGRTSVEPSNVQLHYSKKAVVNALQARTEEQTEGKDINKVRRN